MKDCIRERENIEWSNTWIANADKEGPRCLLIGDSVTREIRAELDRFLFHKFSIDLFAASYALNEAMLWRGLEMFLEAGYRYEIIIIHYGFHHG